MSQIQIIRERGSYWLQYDPVCLGEGLPTFRGNAVSSFQGPRTAWVLKMMSLLSFDTSRPTQPTTRNHVLENLNLQIQRCGNIGLPSPAAARSKMWVCWRLSWCRPAAARSKMWVCWRLPWCRPAAARSKMWVCWRLPWCRSVFSSYCNDFFTALSINPYPANVEKMVNS